MLDKEGGCVSNEEITLWFGNEGSRLDKYGNVYSVRKDVPQDEDYIMPDLISIYQSVLRELGVSVRVNEFTQRDPKSWRMKHIIIHEFETNGCSLPYLHKSIGYEYLE